MLLLPFILSYSVIIRSLSLNRRLRAWASIDASRRCSADEREEDEEREGAEESSSRDDEMVEQSEEWGMRRREGNKSFCVCSCSLMRGGRTQCALCVFLHVCLCAPRALCGSAAAKGLREAPECICTAVWGRKEALQRDEELCFFQGDEGRIDLNTGSTDSHRGNEALKAQLFAATAAQLR